MRAFIAINLPDHERARLHKSLAPLRALSLPVRWLPPESLHVTLKFLGDIDDAQVARVEALLRDVAADTTAFDIEVTGVGAFPNLTRPRVWWVGVHGHVGLMRAQSELEATFASAGHPREERPFSPHITIGRTNAVPRRLPPAAHGAVREIRYDARIHVTSLDLMESQLSADGARYTRRLAPMLLPAVTSPAAPQHTVAPPQSPSRGAGAEPLRPAGPGPEGGGHHSDARARAAMRERARLG